MTRISKNGRHDGGIVIDDRELEWRFIRASGPGGQNVNKVSTAVQLRFDATHSPSLSEDLRARLIRLAGRRATSEGVLVIDARRHRTQARNREDALGRLAALIEKAADTRPPRKKTRPTAASKRRRLASKRRQGAAKRLRGKPDNDTDRGSSE
ncbi:MAG: alternative ribosome rescue aminoacyl-tRNA hydrolase ArfB [Gammaproteobacteria bacterium]